MTDSLPSPPASRSDTPTYENNVQKPLSERLDDLLEQYLELLDQYTLLREQLSKSFSSGFFALAQSQKSSNLGAGRRYGQDCYDERMKALRKIKVVRNQESNTSIFQIEEEDVDTSDRSDTDSMTTDEQKLEVIEKSNTTGSSTASRPSSASKSRDPLRWFGILTPPALRQTQRHFVSAIDESIPRLLSVREEMYNMEHRIMRLRHELGKDEKAINLVED